MYEGESNRNPPRVCTDKFSNLTQTNKQNYVTFNPKQTMEEFNYNTLLNKEAWMTMPSLVFTSLYAVILGQHI